VTAVLGLEVLFGLEDILTNRPEQISGSISLVRHFYNSRSKYIGDL
jgi:hypothetical protein